MFPVRLTVIAAKVFGFLVTMARQTFGVLRSIPPTIYAIFFLLTTLGLSMLHLSQARALKTAQAQLSDVTARLDATSEALASQTEAVRRWQSASQAATDTANQNLEAAHAATAPLQDHIAQLSQTPPAHPDDDCKSAASLLDSNLP